MNHFHIYTMLNIAYLNICIYCGVVNVASFRHKNNKIITFIIVFILPPVLTFTLYFNMNNNNIATLLKDKLFCVLTEFTGYLHLRFVPSSNVCISVNVFNINFYIAGSIKYTIYFVAGMRTKRQHCAT